MFPSLTPHGQITGVPNTGAAHSSADSWCFLPERRKQKNRSAPLRDNPTKSRAYLRTRQTLTRRLPLLHLLHSDASTATPVLRPAPITPQLHIRIGAVPRPTGSRRTGHGLCMRIHGRRPAVVQARMRARASGALLGGVTEPIRARAGATARVALRLFTRAGTSGIRSGAGGRGRGVDFGAAGVLLEGLVEGVVAACRAWDGGEVSARIRERTRERTYRWRWPS